MSWLRFDSTACVLGASLVLVCAVGDYLLVRVSSQKGDFALYAALVDNLTHGSIGFLSWAAATSITNIRENLLCGILASIIDLDHFVSAKSIRLKDATSLAHRPPLHNSLLLTGISVGLLIVGKLVSGDGATRFAWIFTISWSSHHLRDGCRRGLWFGPWSTPPCGRWLYVAAVVLSPLLLKLSDKLSRESTVRGASDSSIV